MDKKKRQKIYDISDNLIWIGISKFSLLLQEYSKLAVNVLTSSPDSSDLMKKNFSYINLAQNDEKVG